MNIIVIICLAMVIMTSYGIYLSFGPPSKDLDDSFEEHEH
tara:strand:+ start:143 stop:262 length:120 start_codon:yes stop_codon:yes gene_type:complete